MPKETPVADRLEDGPVRGVIPGAVDDSLRGAVGEGGEVDLAAEGCGSFGCHILGGDGGEWVEIKNKDLVPDKKKASGLGKGD